MAVGNHEIDLNIVAAIDNMEAPWSFRHVSDKIREQFYMLCVFFYLIRLHSCLHFLHLFENSLGIILLAFQGLCILYWFSKGIVFYIGYPSALYFILIIQVHCILYWFSKGIVFYIGYPSAL